MKKLILKKKILTPLNSNQMNSLLGGNGDEKPTYGDLCTDTCNCNSYYECGTGEICSGITMVCTDGCPSVAAGGCDSGGGPNDWLCVTGGFSLLGLCYSDKQCSQGICTDGCPATVNDGTCMCG